MSPKARLLFVSWIRSTASSSTRPSLPTETDERDPEVPVTSDAPLRSKPRHRAFQPVADAADDAADAPALAVAESF